MKKIIVLLSIFLILAACGNEKVNERSDSSDDGTVEETNGKYETIELDEIENYVQQGYIVADVREVDEFEAGHIPDALNAPLSVLQEGDFSALDRNEKYVIICRSGNRSIQASDILTNEGFHVVNVREGMSSWAGEVEY